MTNTHTRPDEFVASLRRAYRAEFEASPEISAEFLSAADYAAFKLAENPAMIQKMRETCQAIEDEAARQRAIRAGRVRTLGRAIG